MKKNIFFVSIIFVLVFLFSGCASKDAEPRERTETFIADVNPFTVTTLHLYAKINMGKPKISDFTVTFAPRTNTLFIKGRVGVDVIRIGFDYEERKSLSMARMKYIMAYKNSNIPNEKPSKKNAYSNGSVFLEWGGLGTSHDVTTTYMTNAEYLEKGKPYFRLFFNSTGEEASEHVYSPRLRIYISPSQWESIMELCGQEHLEEMTDAILAEANAF